MDIYNIIYASLHIARIVRLRVKNSADNNIRIKKMATSTFGVLFVAWLIYVVLIIIFIVIPAALNISLGVREIYKIFLVKLIKVSEIYCIYLIKVCLYNCFFHKMRENSINMRRTFLTAGLVLL